MKNFILCILFLVLMVSSGCKEKNEEEISEQLKKDLRMDAKDFTEKLKGVLIKEMQTNGIAAAVYVCSDTAQFLAEDYGKSRGIEIKRVSFKNRNKDNTPDEFEEEGLKYFQELLDQGALNESSEVIKVTDQENIKTIRYLKPIIIQAPCLSCHGSLENISPEAASVINSKYPEDKAVGYGLNELRGAVSISKNFIE